MKLILSFLVTLNFTFANDFEISCEGMIDNTIGKEFVALTFDGKVANDRGESFINVIHELYLDEYSEDEPIMTMNHDFDKFYWKQTVEGNIVTLKDFTYGDIANQEITVNLDDMTGTFKTISSAEQFELTCETK